MRHVHPFVVLLASFALLLVAHPTLAYDIKQDYCGVVVNFKYCKCAFHNQYCGDINMSQAGADAYVNGGFQKWACGKEGGTWVGESCQKPQAQVPTPPSDPVSEPEPAGTPDEIAAASQPAAPTACNEAAGMRADDAGVCACKPLYEPAGEEGVCTFAGARGVGFSAESGIDFQELIDGLAPGQGAVFAGTGADGTPVTFGVLRQPDGGYVFTADGRHFFPTAEAAVRPGLWSRIKTGWGDLWRNVGMLVGIGKYTGKDTADDPQKQRDGQFLLDASSQALKELLETANDPEEQFDAAREMLESWPDRAKNYYQGKEEDLFHDALSSATGLDTKTVKNVLAKNWDEIADDKLDAARKSLYAFPAETIKTLASELKKADFANAVALYAAERTAGKKPEELFAALVRGDLPEIETLQMRGASQLYTNIALLTAYENAYQRYLLRTTLQPK